MLTHKGTQTIETSRLLLRKAVREDAEAMFRNWASDPEVTKYLTWPTYEKVETAYQILDLWASEYEKPDYYQWMIVLKVRASTTRKTLMRKLFQKRQSTLKAILSISLRNAETDWQSSTQHLQALKGR